MKSRIVYLKKRIVRNLQRSWTSEELAQAIEISTSQLVRLFQTELELSPAQYVRSVRLEKARELLETTFWRVKEIMVFVGIRDQSHFVRDFKKIYGLTPTEYRDIHHEKSEAEDDARQ